jgi:hypothetical protein
VVRIGKVQQWQKRQQTGELLTSPLNLGELLNPSFFLTALRQQAARETRVPMDSLSLRAALKQSHLQGASLTVCVEGLLLQGATCSAPQGASRRELQQHSDGTLLHRVASRVHVTPPQPRRQPPPSFPLPLSPSPSAASLHDKTLAHAPARADLQAQSNPTCCTTILDS